MILEKLRQFVNWMHDRGIPLPLLRDSGRDAPSISYTMMVISFLFCLLGLLQKLNSTDLDVDMSQALVLLGITTSLYYGRKAQINAENKTVDIDAVVEKKKKEKE